MTPIDPKTPQEWQAAADSAEFFLALDSARQYGLIETDIGIDIERCCEIIRRAKARGITPAQLDQICRRFLKGSA